jgi:triacylglycerol esterase/lipase EstA (alpha/beta hydrolase family)
MFGSLAPARRRLVLTLLVALVLVAGLLTALVVRTAVDRSAVRPVAQQAAGPVLLLPGYGGSTTGLSVLAERLRAAGKDVTVVELPDHAQGDLAGQAAALAFAVKAAVRRTGSPSVDVVGYSAGGVVARLWAKSYGGARFARRVVTLGSPQHGTALAALGSLLAGECPLACQQLISTSPVLAQLNARPEVPAGPVFVSFWTSHDQVVLPPESAELTGALNIEIQSVCPASAVDHTGLPTDPLVARMVAAELAGAAIVPLGAADCARLSG